MLSLWLGFFSVGMASALVRWLIGGDGRVRGESRSPRLLKGRGRVRFGVPMPIRSRIAEKV